MTTYLDEVHITKDGGIIKKMIRQGVADGNKPERGQEVVVKYEGRLEDGTIFDSSDEHGEPLKINIGTG